MKKILLVNVALVVVLFALFDGAAYWLVPERMLGAFPGYRTPPRPIEPGAAGWPRGYYIADATRGFDIGTRRRAQYWVDGQYFPIWSNAAGCFDREHEGDESYVYFAGDSFTWGYARFEDKFGTRLEQASGHAIYKCGVEHTGQRHQFSKFMDVTAHVGHAPSAVFVFHFENDVANDFAHPHSTVVDGWLIDDVVTNARHELIRRPTESLAARLAARIDEARVEAARPSGLREGLGASVRRYSLIANFVGAALSARRRRSADGSTAPPATDASATLNFYSLPYLRNGAYWYRDNPLARPNQDALLAFKGWSDEHHVPLVIVLIPRHRDRFDPAFYGELHAFLRDHQMRFIDLAGPFQQRHLAPAEVYWRGDPHFNAAGNAAVADVLRDSFPQFFAPSRQRTAMP